MNEESVKVDNNLFSFWKYCKHINPQKNYEYSNSKCADWLFYFAKLHEIVYTNISNSTISAFQKGNMGLKCKNKHVKKRIQFPFWVVLSETLSKYLASTFEIRCKMDMGGFGLLSPLGAMPNKNKYNYVGLNPAALMN